MRLVIIFALTFLAMAACSGGSDGDSTPTPTITPEFHVINGTVTINGTTCELLPTSRYAALPGLEITVSDAQGVALGTGKLALQGITNPDPPTCVLRFSIPNVPLTPSYTISSSAFPPIAYIYTEMVDSNWSIGLEVGTAGS